MIWAINLRLKSQFLILTLHRLVNVATRLGPSSGKSSAMSMESTQAAPTGWLSRYYQWSWFFLSWLNQFIINKRWSNSSRAPLTSSWRGSTCTTTRPLAANMSQGIVFDSNHKNTRFPLMAMKWWRLTQSELNLIIQGSPCGSWTGNHGLC